MSLFPAAAFLTAQKRWIGKECIVLPTIAHAVGSTLQSKRVLDVGCGNGAMCWEYLQMGAREVVGIDTNAEMIRNCLWQFKGDSRLSFEQSSAFEMQYDAEFDVVMAIFVLQFNETQRDLQKSLRNIAKAMKPGGWLYGYVPNGVADVNPIEAEGVKLGSRMVLESIPPKDGERIKVCFYSSTGELVAETPITFFYRSTYERCLQEAGFQDVEWIYPCVSDKAISEFGQEFFRSYLHTPKEIMFRAQRRTRNSSGSG